MGRVCKMWSVVVPGHGNDGRGNEREVLSRPGPARFPWFFYCIVPSPHCSQLEGGDCECAEARADIRPRPIRNQNSRTDVMGGSEPP